MKNVKWITVLLLSVLLLQGCAMFTPVKSSGGTSSLVVRIEIEKRPFDNDEVHIVTETDQIDLVLDYMKDLSLSEVPEQYPDMEKAATCIVKYHYVDGGEKNIYMVSDHYVRDGKGPWMRIVDEPENTLMEILDESKTCPDIGRES